MTREEFIKNVESTQKAFRRFLTALNCGCSRLADDIAQESYIKAYLSCDGLKNSESFRAWLYRIGYTTFLNFQRTDRPLQDYSSLINQPGGNPADSDFKYQDLYLALDMIPPHERSSILLFYMEGYSIEDIAGIENISKDAVKQHLSRGRKHLRKIYQNI